MALVDGARMKAARGLVLALALAACKAPAPGGSSADASPTVCTRFGQSCEFSPGKLGTCVQRDECAGEACFVCQSQH